MSIPELLMIPTEINTNEKIKIQREEENEKTKYSWDYAVQDSYKKQNKIAHGSSSIIHLARHYKHRRVVIKEYIDPSRLIDSEYELYLLKMCQDCGPIVYDTWISREGTFNIAMEEMSCTLYDCLVYMEMRMMNKIVFIKNFFKKIRDLHKKVVHFDLKPQNIGILANFECKLLDFGLAEKVESLTDKIFIEEMDYGNIVKMSTFYRPPEGFLPLDPMTEKSDIWSVGCILWDLVSENPDEPLFNGIELDESPDSDPDKGGVFYKDFILKKGIERVNKLKDGQNTIFIQKMYDTISNCLRYNQNERPSAQELVDDWNEFMPI
jgi:serine/threonine protein kinase